jgi:hypothetical protein
MQQYTVRVFKPIVYTVSAQDDEQAAQKPVEWFKKDIKAEQSAYIANSCIDPETEVLVDGEKNTEAPGISGRSGR